MKFGTISEKGKSQIIVRVDEEHACKLTELEQLQNIYCGQSILELIKIIGEKKDFLLHVFVYLYLGSFFIFTFNFIN